MILATPNGKKKVTSFLSQKRTGTSDDVFYTIYTLLTYRWTLHMKLKCVAYEITALKINR